MINGVPFPAAGGGTDPELEGRVEALESNQGAISTITVTVDEATFGAAGAVADKGYMLFLGNDDWNPGGLFGVAQTDAAVGETVTLSLTGIHNLGSSGFFPVIGAAVYYDPAEDVLGVPEEEGVNYRIYKIGTCVGDDGSDFVTRLDGTFIYPHKPVSGIALIGAPIRERKLQFEEIAVSGTWSKAEVLARPEFADVDPSAIRMLILACGGGSGGSVGTDADGYGGYPGALAWRRFTWDDIGETETVSVGAGGLSEDDGGTSFFGDHVKANGGRNITFGTEVDANTYYNLRKSQAKVPDLREQDSNFSSSWPSSIDGPAGGGSVGTNRATQGGHGSENSFATITYGGTSGQNPGIDGENAQAGQFWSFGAGGAAGSGKGGFPGGGGGAAASGTAGTGGDGCVRILYTVMEIV